MNNRVKKATRISLIAGAAIVLVSGCSQGATTKDGTGNSQQANATLSYAGGWTTNGVTNPFGSNNIIQNDLSYVPLAWYKYTGNYDYWKVLASNWEMSKDGKTFTVNINPKAKWSDGSPVTAEDVYVTFELQLLTGNAESWGLSGMKIVNSHTIEFTRDLNTLYSTVMFERQILNNIEIFPAKVYKKFIPSNLWSLVRDWNGNPNAQSTKNATAELTQYATKAQSANMSASDLIYNGPWSLVRTSSSQELYQKNPDYLFANNVNAGKVIALNQTTNDVTWRALENGQLDYAGVGYSQVVYKQVMKVHQNSYISAPGTGGMALYFNENVAPFNNVKVRQALAYAIDRPAAQEIGEPIGYFNTSTITGMIPSVENQWLTPNQLSSLSAYNYDQNKAAQLLESAGFKKTSSGWVMPNGKPFTFNLTVPNLSDWLAGVNAISTQLQKEGINAQTAVVDTTTWTQEVPLGKYAVYANWWGGGDVNPSAPYNQLYISDNNYQVSTTGQLKNTATAQNQQQEAIPESINVPGLGTVNPMALSVQLLGDMPQQKEKNIVYQLAKTTNYDVPLIPIWGQAAGRTISSANWTWPDYTNNLAIENCYSYHTPFVVFETLGLMKPKK
ncbi:ABC transporter substrate-binding protein [Alicyclobacillus fastidiosus]|uniref:ABC transporter substrate-binding protein n=1 Tax=Alicyclobacillus fastidiosus TaxID=392011 RepID=A0ABY6ZEQ6_9BACL|nr:ABC transporter substrate-binding protein [Alicyclobacillus fastidiosus]WAH41308.1 ABC transporter substrate-binding protein [Alicyclobacillus fastidiosus]GMA62910.1 hypothetical protein GCM10025859_33500 [Alicyclobacillus fastidiosus]